MSVLFTYNPEEFSVYRRSMVAQGYSIHSFSDVPNKLSIEDAQTNSKLIIDLSSTANLIKCDNANIYRIEEILRSLYSKIIYVADIKFKDCLLYNLRFIFESSEPLQVDISEYYSTSQEEKHEIIRPVKRIIDLNDQELKEFFDAFNSKLYGHDRFKSEFKSLISTFRVFNQIGEHKILSLFLMGDSGVGKTEVARCINRCLSSNSKLAKINFGNYSSHDSLNSLIGSPLGYIGSDGGELIKRVMESTNGVILIDEFEKANISVFNYFLDVLESGKITNSQADEVDINGYIIVFTSNTPKTNFKSTFSPELRSRFDYKGTFNLLTDEDKTKYTHNRINEIVAKYCDVSSTILDQKMHSRIFAEINVSNYKNMRDLNKRIKDVFVKYVTI